MPRIIFNDGEEVVFQDFNDLQSLLEKDLHDEVLRRMFQDEDGFIGTGFFPTFINATTIALQPGRGFQQDGTVDADEPQYRGIDIDIATNVTLNAADVTNPRKDIIAVKWSRTVYETANRDVKAAIGGLVTNETVDKKEKWTADIQYVAGTPAGSPSAPATPSGYLLVAEILVPAGTGPTSQSNVTDKRNSLNIGANISVDINTSAYTTVATKAAQVPVGTVTKELDAEIQANRTTTTNLNNLLSGIGGADFVGTDVNTPGDWDSAPAKVMPALDELASRTKQLEGDLAVGSAVSNGLKNHIVDPSKSRFGADNEGLLDNASTNPRGLKLADLKASYGEEVIPLYDIRPTGKSLITGIPEWEVVSPKRDNRIRLYGGSWTKSGHPTGDFGAHLNLNESDDNGYLEVTGIFSGLALMCIPDSANSEQIEVELDGSLIGTLSMTAIVPPTEGFPQHSMLSSPALYGLNWGLHTAKFRFKLGAGASRQVALSGLVLFGNGKYSEAPGNAFLNNELVSFQAENNVPLPEVDEFLGARVRRYLDPSSKRKRWVVSQIPAAKTWAPSITVSATVLTVNKADDFEAGDIAIIESAPSNAVKHKLASVNPGADTMTLVSGALFNYTDANINRYAKVLNFDLNDTNEELSRVLDWREFGSGDSNDALAIVKSSVVSNVSGRTNDGYHFLEASQCKVEAFDAARYSGDHEGIQLDNTTGEIVVRFVGTGLSMLAGWIGLTGTIDMYVDGVKDSFSLPENLPGKVINLIGGMPFGSHVVRFITTDNANDFAIHKFYVHMPKTPNDLVVSDYPQYQKGVSFVLNSTSQRRLAQSFVLSDATYVTRISLPFRKRFTTDGVVTLGLQADSAGSPSGSYLSSETRPADDFYDFQGGGYPTEDIDSNWDVQVNQRLAPGTYWIVVEGDGTYYADYTTNGGTSYLAPVGNSDLSRTDEGVAKKYDGSTWSVFQFTFHYNVYASLLPVATTISSFNGTADPRSLGSSTYETFTQKVAQGFTLTVATYISDVGLDAVKSGEPHGTLSLKLLGNSGGIPDESNVIAEKKNIHIGGINSMQASNQGSLVLSVNKVLQPGTYYVAVVDVSESYRREVDVSSGANRLLIKSDTSGGPPYKRHNGSSWSTDSTHQLKFFAKTLDGRLYDDGGLLSESMLPGRVMHSVLHADTYPSLNNNSQNSNPNMHDQYILHRMRYSNAGSVGGSTDWTKLSVLTTPWSKAMRGDRDNAFVETWFYGTGFFFHLNRASARGIWRIEVDGLALTTANFPNARLFSDAGQLAVGSGNVDMYSATAQFGTKAGAYNLTEGVHKVKFINTNTKNGSSSGFFCDLHGFSVAGPRVLPQVLKKVVAGNQHLSDGGSSIDMRLLNPVKMEVIPASLYCSGRSVMVKSGNNDDSILEGCHGVIETTGGTVHIVATVMSKSNNATVNQNTLKIYVNGKEMASTRQQQSAVQDPQSMTVSAQVNLPPGRHFIAAHWNPGAGNSSSTEDAERKLTAVEVLNA